MPGKTVIRCPDGTLFVYALQHDNKVRDATISLLQFERWQMSFHSLGIFENQEEINRKVLARFSDVCDKQFSSLAGNRDRLGRYVSKALRMKPSGSERD